MGQCARDYLPIVFVFLVAAECNILFLHSPIYFKQFGMAGTKSGIFVSHWFFLWDFCAGSGVLSAIGAADSVVCCRASDCCPVGRAESKYSGKQGEERRKAAVFVCISFRCAAEGTSGTVSGYTECEKAVAGAAGADAKTVNIGGKP